MNVDLDELLQLASETAILAGRSVAATSISARAPVGTKSSRTDLVTAADRATEALISSRILAARPHDSVLGEEGANTTGNSGVRWVVDPIDGTVNFAYGMPGYCTSIAAEVDGEIVVGAVFDPSREELFRAKRGGGAFLNADAITRSRIGVSLAEAIVGTGFDYRSARRLEQATLLLRVLPAIGDIRRIGSAALQLCWVACGRLDAYYESGTHLWDHAAGSLIATEAGAVVTALDASPVPDATLMAAPPMLARALAALLTAG